MKAGNLKKIRIHELVGVNPYKKVDVKIYRDMGSGENGAIRIRMRGKMWENLAGVRNKIINVCKGNVA